MNFDTADKDTFSAPNPTERNVQAPAQTVSGEQKNFEYRRLPAVEKKINDITAEDIRVRITGNIIDKNDDAMVLDDGTSKAEIILEEDVKIPENDFVRVFAKVIALESGFELRGEIIQDMSGINKDLWHKIRDSKN